jgi:hypothetical protein
MDEIVPAFAEVVRTDTSICFAAAVLFVGLVIASIVTKHYAALSE